MLKVGMSPAYMCLRLCRFVFDGIDDSAVDSALGRAVRYYNESKCGMVVEMERDHCTWSY